MIRNVFSMFDYISHSVPMEKFHDLGKQNRISIIFCMTIYLKYNILYNTPESFGNRKNDVVLRIMMMAVCVTHINLIISL